MNTLQKYEKYFYGIILIGFIVYFPIFFNGFVWDDYDYILNNSQIHLLNIPALFGPNIFNTGPFYRPLPAVYFAFLYAFFGSHAFLYHLIELILHITGASLLFLFFCLFFGTDLSFFLALLFLVHPINVESVAYIGASQSELYFIPGLIALLLANKKELSKTRFYIIIGLICISIFTKETGFLYIPLIILYRYLFNLGKLKQFFLASVALCILYLIARIFVGNVIFEEAGYIAIINLPLFTRLLNIPAIITYYAKTFIFPMTLAVWQQWIVTTITLQSFYIPLLVCLFLAILIFAEGLYLFRKDTKRPIQNEKHHDKKKKLAINNTKMFPQFIFFLAWLLLGMGLILQIIPLDMTVADRWFYFPVVGLLGLIGIMLQVVLDTRPYHRKPFIICTVIILCLFSLRSFVRTFDYKNNITLYSHDLKTSSDSDNLMVLDSYIVELRGENRNEEALQSAEKGTTLNNNPIATRITDYDYLALLYQEKDQSDIQALPAYEKAATLAKYTTAYDIKQSFVKGIYDNLASSYLFENKYEDLITFINGQALQKFPDDSCLYGHLAVAQSALGNQRAAQDASLKAYKLTQISDTNPVPSQEDLNRMCNFTSQ
jgi:hypothetical protein